MGTFASRATMHRHRLVCARGTPRTTLRKPSILGNSEGSESRCHKVYPRGPSGPEPEAWEGVNNKEVPSLEHQSEPRLT